MDESPPDLSSAHSIALETAYTEVQQNLYYTLDRLSSPVRQLAQLYLSSLHLRNCPNLPGREFLIAHAMREIVAALPRIANEDLQNNSTGNSETERLCSGWNNLKKETASKEELCEFVDGFVKKFESRLTTNNQYYVAWEKLDTSPVPAPEHIATGRIVRLRRLNNDMKSIAHLRNAPENFEQLVSELEELLLDILTPQTLPNLQRIDDYVNKIETSDEEPNQEEIKRIIVRIVEYRHFCSKISLVKWLKPLSNLGFFNPDLLDPLARPTNLPALEYLERIATEDPDKVAPHIDTLARTNNIYYSEFAVRLLPLLPISKVKRITKRLNLKKLSASSYRLSIDAAALAMHFVKSGEPALGTSIVNELMRLRLAPDQLSRSGLVSVIGDDAFAMVCKTIQDHFEPKTCEPIMQLMVDSAARQGAIYDDATVYRSTAYVRPAIGDHGRNGYYRNHPLSQLIETSRILAVRYVTETQSEFDAVLNLCVSTGASTGFRLALFLIKEFDAYERDSAKQLFSTAILCDRNCIHEVSEALPEFFGRSQDTLKRDIFEQIMAVENQYLRRDLLVMIEEHLDTKMTARFREIVGTMGRSNLPSFTFQDSTMTFGIESPVPSEEIQSWTMEALVIHAREIEARDDSNRREDLEGLAIAIGRQVRKDPTRFVNGSHFLIRCPLPVLSRVLWGLQSASEILDQPLAATCYKLLEWAASLQFSHCKNELDLIHTSDVKRMAAVCMLTSLRPPWQSSINGDFGAIWNLIESFFENSLDEVISESDDLFFDGINSTLGVSLQLTLLFAEMENRGRKLRINTLLPECVRRLLDRALRLNGHQEKVAKCIISRSTKFLVALDKSWFLSNKTIFYSNAHPHEPLFDVFQSLFVRSNTDFDLETIEALRDELLCYYRNVDLPDSLQSNELSSRVCAFTIFGILGGRFTFESELTLEILDPAHLEILLLGLDAHRQMLMPFHDSLDSEFRCKASDFWQLILDSESDSPYQARLVYRLSEWIADHLFEWEASRSFLSYVIKNCQSDCLTNDIFTIISDERIAINESLEMLMIIWKQKAVREYYWINNENVSVVLSRAIRLGEKPDHIFAKNFINLLASDGKTGYEALLD